MQCEPPVKSLHSLCSAVINTLRDPPANSFGKLPHASIFSTAGSWLQPAPSLFLRYSASWEAPTLQWSRTYALLEAFRGLRIRPAFTSASWMQQPPKSTPQAVMAGSCCRRALYMRYRTALAVKLHELRAEKHLKLRLCGRERAPAAALPGSPC